MLQARPGRPNNNSSGFRRAETGRGEILRQEMDQAILRATLAYKIFFSIGEAAPAFGMFGTLVGLIQMLSSLDDPTKVGAGLAVALLTTLYGVLISYLFAMPIAEKLDQKSLEDKENRALIMECIILIRQLKNPNLMYDFLESYLPEHMRGAVQAEFGVTPTSEEN